MFAVGLMGGLMPRWCGEVGENPTLTRNRDHACVVWESGYQITWGWPWWGVLCSLSAQCVG